MKKKLALLVLVILIALSITTPALAGRGKASFTFGGYITAIDDDMITLRTARDRLVTVQVSGGTSFFQWTSEGRVPITFSEVEVGDSTNIRGTIVDDVYFASRVTVDVPLNCKQLFRR